MSMFHFIFAILNKLRRGFAKFHRTFTIKGSNYVGLQYEFFDAQAYMVVIGFLFHFERFTWTKRRQAVQVFYRLHPGYEFFKNIAGRYRQFEF